MNMNMKMKMDTNVDMDTNVNVEHGHWNFCGFVIVSLQNHNTAPAQYRKCTVGYNHTTALGLTVIPSVGLIK
jgi:hypothetical protein